MPNYGLKNLKCPTLSSGSTVILCLTHTAPLPKLQSGRCLLHDMKHVEHQQQGEGLSLPATSQENKVFQCHISAAAELSAPDLQHCPWITFIWGLGTLCPPLCLSFCHSCPSLWLLLQEMAPWKLCLSCSSEFFFISSSMAWPARNVRFKFVDGIVQVWQASFFWSRSLTPIKEVCDCNRGYAERMPSWLQHSNRYKWVASHLKELLLDYIVLIRIGCCRLSGVMVIICLLLEQFQILPTCI